MNDLLTTKQVQELLQIDRTTVYRMLNDGRLTGIKVGKQWRFKQREIDELLRRAATPVGSRTSSIEVLPFNCIQSIQKVFATIAEVAAITTDPDGQPLTEVSNCSQFCAHFLESSSGRQACIQSWKHLAENQHEPSQFIPCHAGLEYTCSWIKINDQPVAMIVTGQFYSAPPDPAEEDSRLRQLSSRHHIDYALLTQAARQIPVLDARKVNQIGVWLKGVASSFGELGRDRADVLQRFRMIAEMSNLEMRG